MSKIETFAVGDVVWLKSGGPAMTVTATWDNGTISAVWYSDSNYAEQHDFSAACITKKEPTI